jgi:hypothetical protein
VIGEPRNACKSEPVFGELISHVRNSLLRGLALHLRAQQFNLGRNFRFHAIRGEAVELRGRGLLRLGGLDAAMLAITCKYAVPTARTTTSHASFVPSIDAFSSCFRA